MGTWNWMGSPYYVFDEDGSGDMFGTSILWETDNGTLYICITPSLCGSVSACLAPARWAYELDGNQLALGRVPTNESQ